MNYSLPQSLDPHRWPFGLEWLPEAAHLVGGSVRDGLLGRRSSHLDLDFVLPHHAVNTARAIAQHYGTGFVVLDAEHQIARIVFDSVTADFADQVGHSLNDDLHRRDFTINAIAYHPKTETVVDPLSGRLDLEQKTIRMISRDNLVEDPLRLLRAYRQAAQLDFWIEPATQDAIEDLAALLKHVAPERVYSELSYLLSHPKGTEMLIRAWKSHLLQVWLPHIQWESLKRVEAVDDAIAQVISRWHVMGDLLKGWPRDQQHAVGGGRSWLKVAKLTCLLHDHPAVAEDELWQLKCSRLEVQSVLTILRHRELIKSGAIATLSRRDLYFLFQDVGDVFPAVAVLAIAGGVSLQAITPLIERFLNPSDPVAHPHPLVTGRDIMAHLHLSPGPQIGKLLSQIQIAQAEGSILTSEDALNLAQTLVSFPSP
ncbi:MAG: CCA tRNA nucleotidyltransferase [Elainellaceae cyanobacterium]